MAEQPTPHADLAGHILGRLGPADQTRFAQHLEDCAECREALRELSPVPALMESMAPRLDPPPGLEERTLAAVRRAAGESASPAALERDATPPVRSRRRPRLAFRRLAFAGGLAAALAVAVLAGAQLGGDGDAEPGTLELQAALVAPGGGSAQAAAEVRNTGTGRVVSFSSDDLPILPKGDLYEVWFVGPGDSRARPNRISAGTFHPDEAGRSRVRLHAAVDPSLYPVVSVTAEPGDGDPAPSGPEVLRSRTPQS